MQTPKPTEEMTRAELIRELEAELEKPLLPESDWYVKAHAKLEHIRKILRESPMGRGRV